MAATAKIYLPDLNKSVWVNCTDESVSIGSADCMWNEAGSDSLEREVHVIFYETLFGDEIPDEAQPWLPMIQKTLAYTIEQETTYYGENYIFYLPVAWLPESIRQTAEPEYLDWLQANEKEIGIAQNGQIIIDEEYLKSVHLQPASSL